MNVRIRYGMVLVAGCATVVFSGCGGSRASPAPDYAKALHYAPPPLSKLYSEGNQLLSGGREAFENRLNALHGYPVVVNIWASWCGGCVTDFPTFQSLSARFGSRVAFLGVDSFDDHDAAATMLREAPLPYPSYSDFDQDLARSFGPTGLPATAFLDRTGELVFLKRGSYRDAEELEEEIRNYALGAR